MVKDLFNTIRVIREEKKINGYVKREYKVYDEYEISLIGYAAVIVEENVVHIGVINVNRDYRGRGIGTAILLSILGDFSDKKIEVKTFNYLVPWYEKHGFKLLNESGNIFHLIHLPSL